MNIKILGTLLLLIISAEVVAQNTVNYNLYNYSLNLINPAFAGRERNTQLLINSRMQWTGVPDAPRTNTFALTIPFKNNLGIGLNVISDKIFVFNQTQVSLDISYQLQLSDEQQLLFGIKAQGNIYSGAIDQIKIATQNDAFFAEAVNKFSPNFSVGAAIVHEDYTLHAVIKGVLFDNRYKDMQGLKKKNRLDIAFGGLYNLPIDDRFTLVPSILVNIAPGAPLAFDLNNTLKINDKHQVGLSYSWNNSLQLNGLIGISKWLKMGYGYTHYTNEISSYQSGSHELMLLCNMDTIF